MPRNGIEYRKTEQDTTRKPRLLVTETKLSRDMSAVVRGAKTVRTIIYQDMVKMILYDAYSETKCLRSVVVGKELEVQCKDYMLQRQTTIFKGTGLRLVIF